MAKGGPKGGQRRPKGGGTMAGAADLISREWKYEAQHLARVNTQKLRIKRMGTLDIKRVWVYKTKRSSEI